MLSSKLIFLGAVLVVGQTDGNSQVLETPRLQESDSVAKLRELLKSELSENYMKEDYWLRNWLAANEFNVEITALLLKEYLQFRAKLFSSSVASENSYHDWTAMRTLFPYPLSSTDKNGRPLLYIDFDQWDIAGYVTTEEASQRLTFYVGKMKEDAEAKVRQFRAEGKNITQYTELYNLGGFGLTKHVCMQCMSFYRKTADLLTPYTAANTGKIVFVNVPYVFKMVYYLLNNDIRKLIQLYGQDQEEVKRMLYTYIDPEQIPNGLLDEIIVADNTEGSMMWDKEL